MEGKKMSKISLQFLHTLGLIEKPFLLEASFTSGESLVLSVAAEKGSHKEYRALWFMEKLVRLLEKKKVRISKFHRNTKWGDKVDRILIGA